MGQQENRCLYDHRRLYFSDLFQLKCSATGASVLLEHHHSLLSTDGRFKQGLASFTYNRNYSVGELKDLANIRCAYWTGAVCVLFLLCDHTRCHIILRMNLCEKE